MKCIRCKHEIDDDSNFCKYCGGSVGFKQYNDLFVDTPEQNLFAQIFGFDMPLDRQLTEKYRRPIPDMDKFEQLFHLKHGDNCNYYTEPTLKGYVDYIYGSEVAQWLEDLIPNLICYERTMSDMEIKQVCQHQSSMLRAFGRVD